MAGRAASLFLVSLMLGSLFSVLFEPPQLEEEASVLESEERLFEGSRQFSRALWDCGTHARRDVLVAARRIADLVHVNLQLGERADLERHVGFELLHDQEDAVRVCFLLHFVITPFQTWKVDGNSYANR